MTQEVVAPWYSATRAAWDRRVRAWLAQVGRANWLGEVQAVTTVKERPWSVVRQVTFDQGRSYFKACGAGGRHEPALLLFLQEQMPTSIPRIQAVEPHRHWILMADAGMPLAETLDGAQQLRAIARLLPHYARMQMASLASVDRLLEMGLPDRRVNRLPQLLRRLMGDEVVGVGQSVQAVQALRQSASRLMPRLEKVCDQLATSAYAKALDHGDLHQGNLLLRDGAYRLGDWGDACVTHPFCSIMVTLETALSQVAEGERERWARTLRDAYLQPWCALAPPERLRRDLEHALWLAHIVRALNCAHMFVGADEETLNRWRPLIFEQLQLWVAHSEEA